MAGVRLRYDARAFDQLAKGFRELKRRGEDTQPLFDEIGSQLVASVADRFEHERGPDGQRWAPSRRAREEGGQTLTDSARLRQSITHTAGRDEVEVGTNVVYAAIHQFGGEIRKKARKGKSTIYGRYNATTGELRRFTRRRGANVAFDYSFRVGAHTVEMPPRPFLGISAGDEAAVGDTVRDYLTGIFQP